MKATRIALAATLALLLIMSMLAGVVFMAGALYLAIATQVSPAFAALITAGLLFLPLMSAMLYMTWQIHRQRQRRVRRRQALDALKAALQAGAEDDPYGFVTSAFISGVLLSTKPGTRERITQIMNLCSGTYTAS